MVRIPKENFLGCHAKFTSRGGADLVSFGFDIYIAYFLGKVLQGTLQRGICLIEVIGFPVMSYMAIYVYIYV